MSREVRVSEGARRLGVSSGLLRRIEHERKVPPARRDRYGARIYSETDLARLRAMGVGQRPARYKRPEDMLGAAR